MCRRDCLAVAIVLGILLNCVGCRAKRPHPSGSRQPAVVPGPAADQPPVSGARTAVLISTCDLHGHLEPRTYPFSHGRPVGGAAYLSAYIARIRAEYPGQTALVDVGDMFQGTLLSDQFRGQPVVAWMNAVGYDVATLGNHEFRWGLDALRQRAAIRHQAPGVREPPPDT